MDFDIDTIRQQFPALNMQAIFFDNPGGTQIAKPALERMISYLTETNANHDGAFSTSIASDANKPTQNQRRLVVRVTSVAGNGSSRPVIWRHTASRTRIRLDLRLPRATSTETCVAAEWRRRWHDEGGIFRCVMVEILNLARNDRSAGRKCLHY